MTVAGKQACFPKPVCNDNCCGRFQVSSSNQSSNLTVCNNCVWMAFSQISISYAWYVFRGCMKENPRGCSLWVLCGGRQTICTPSSQAQSITSTSLEWEEWPSSVRILGSFLDGFTKRTKYLNFCVKLSFWVHPALWQAATEPGGVLSRSSAFTLILGNTRRGGTYVTVAFMQTAIVTSEPLSAEDRDILRFLLREVTLHTLCWTTMRPVSS